MSDNETWADERKSNNKGKDKDNVRYTTWPDQQKKTMIWPMHLLNFASLFHKSTAKNFIVFFFKFHSRTPYIVEELLHPLFTCQNGESCFNTISWSFDSTYSSKNTCVSSTERIFQFLLMLSACTVANSFHTAISPLPSMLPHLKFSSLHSTFSLFSSFDSC